MKLIENNPYRILGVYANSRRQEIVANKGKASAFLRVGKPVEFPIDLKGILPPLSRTLDMMNEAEAHLSIAKEQIKYSQFWFLKAIPLDEVAFNNLIAGNIDTAMSIWSKQESISSLQNKIICYLIKDNIESAISIAEKLYGSFGDNFISLVDSNSTLKMSGADLMHLFIETLGEEIGAQKLLRYTHSPETKAYLQGQAVDPLISSISSEVERTKKVSHNDPKARIEAARTLITNTKEAFNQLKSILPVSDPQYLMIADKLGLEILQCGIDYFNNSEEDDAPHTAMEMQKYAQSVVAGSLAKQRCNENLKTLQKIIDELPPKQVMAEDKAIKAELAKYVRLPDKISHAITLLNNTKRHLQAIKQKLGNKNEYYLRISTQIVNNALHNVVEEVNLAQQPLAKIGEMLGKMDPRMRSLYFASSSDAASKIKEIENNVKSTLREAWRATLLMDEFDLESSFKSKYRDNRNILKSLCDSMGVSTYVSKASNTSPSTRSINYSRPSTAYSSSSSSSSSSNENYGCIIWIAVMLAAGAILAGITNSAGGFFFGCLIVAGIWGKTKN